MRKAYILVLTGVFVIATSVTSQAAADREHLQMMADIRMLQEQTQQLQNVLEALTEALGKVSAKIDGQTELSRKTLADQKLTIDNVGDGVRIVREKIDDTNVRISSLSQEIEALRLAIPPVLPAVPGLTSDMPVPAGPGEPVAPATQPVAPAANPGLGMSPQRTYDSAMADYGAGQWNLAIAGFETYVKIFPKSELADDAQFYIGESYYTDGKYKEAAAAYEQLIQNYPTGNRVPDAYYKRGLAMERLDQVDRARDSFELVTKAYPDSDASRLAKQALDRLNRR